jgi:GntR family transcriptional regulator / MocR family aminotransferase
MSSVLVQIDHNSDTPVRSQIVDAYASAIRDGRIKAGSRLPSIRALALRLKVSPATIVAAYRELSDISLVSSAPRSSFFVSGGSPVDETKKTLQMNRIEPDLRMHPVQDFLRLLPQLGALDSSVGGYEEYRGYQGLRDALADLDRQDGILSDPVNGMLITSGAQQGITITARVFGSGARIAVENPCFPGAHIAFRNAGADIFPVRMTEDGPSPDSLREMSVPGRVSAFYCCPTYGNPRGWTWSENSRLRVLEAARLGGFVVIEDDYLGDLDYLGEKPRRLASLAQEIPGVSVVRIKTFSKCLLPSLRLAGVSGSPAIITKLLSQKVSDDIGCSAILQRGLARFISDGQYATHLARVRPRYRASREALRSALLHVGSGLRFDDPPSGLCLLGYLPEDIELSRFVSECERQNVIIASGNDYWHSGLSLAASFRVGFGALTPDEISRAVNAFSIAAVRAREYSIDHSLI